MTDTRPIQPADFPALAGFIGQANETSGRRDLHTFETPAAALVQEMQDLHGADRLIGLMQERDGTILGSIVLDIDREKARAWAWGPSLTTGEDGGRLLDAALDLLPDKISRISFFPASENLDLRAILAARNARFHPATHVYRALPNGRTPSVPGDVRRAGLRDRDALHRLHEANFPASYRSIDEMLAADAERACLMVVAAEGAPAGYVAATVQQDGTGYIDFLATDPAYRRRGVAGTLLTAALAWLFDDRRVPSAHLTVTDDKAVARRLYERCGFRLHTSGIPADLYR